MATNKRSAGSRNAFDSIQCSGCLSKGEKDIVEMVALSKMYLCKKGCCQRYRTVNIYHFTLINIIKYLHEINSRVCWGCWMYGHPPCNNEESREIPVDSSPAGKSPEKKRFDNRIRNEEIRLERSEGLSKQLFASKKKKKNKNKKSKEKPWTNAVI